MYVALIAGDEPRPDYLCFGIGLCILCGNDGPHMRIEIIQRIVYCFPDPFSWKQFAGVFVTVALFEIVQQVDGSCGAIVHASGGPSILLGCSVLGLQHRRN